MRQPLMTSSVAAALASVPGLAAQYSNDAARYGALSDDRIRGMTAAYLRSVAWVDDRIGELLAGLEERGLTDETVVVTFDVQGKTLVLVSSQMSYHHVAQGEMEGEPWMVSF
ncbi:MAG: sulfatase-like hydrolase/transferase [Gemmatimonadetes bacterium]|nr:sulfatase-like hydrolase/transferase [Gemmatimonadota bacterium]